MLRRAACLTSLVVAACAAPPSLPFDSPEIPDAVREAAGSAVQMVFFPPGMEAPLQPAQAEKFREAATTTADLGSRAQRLAHALADDLAASDRERNMGLAGFAWGFIAEEATCLWTCAHNLDLYFPKVGDSVELVLFDNEERILFDSRNEGDEAIVEHFGPGERQQMTLQGSEGLLTDHARIRLSRAPCSHLASLRTSPVALGERVFVPINELRGAPAKLHGAFFAGAIADAPSSFDSYHFEPIAWTEELKRSLVFTSCYAAPGQSGSPIFDSEGAIIGITCHGKENRAGGIHAHRLAASRNPDTNAPR